MFFPTWDLSIYLLCLQISLIIPLWKVNKSEDNKEVLQVFFIFTIATTAFWLIWGGYGLDAWRYLSRFDHNPLGFEEEQLFWIIGNYLGQVVNDPWPLKILSAFSILVLSLSYYLYYKDHHSKYLQLSYLLLLITPGFFLLMGNAVRQGIAGSIEILGAVFLFQGNYILWIILLFPGLLIHKYSVIVFISAIVSKLFKRYVIWIWLISMLFGYFLDNIAMLLGINIENYLDYISKSEGSFHYAKFAITTLISIAVVISIRLQSNLNFDFRHFYLILVSFSNCLLPYEVPYERILLFTDLVAPLAIAQVFYCHIQKQFFYKAALLSSILFGLVLWSHKSILLSIGHLKFPVEL